MNTSSPSALFAASQAFQLMKRVLFKPFNATRWFGMGFCAWLCTLGTGGGGGGCNYTSNTGNNSFQGLNPEIKSFFQKIFSDSALLSIVIAGVVVVLLIILAFSVLFCWLRSRGDFMFLQRAYTPDEPIGACWNRAAYSSRSLFYLRLGYMAAGWAILIVLLVPAWFYFLQPLFKSGFGFSALFPQFIILCAAGMALGLAWRVLTAFTYDFVVPIMYWNNMPALRAWREVLALCAQHPLSVFVYFILMHVWILLFLLAILLIALCTCCIGFIVLIIPYIGTVAMLPMYLFDRAYSVYFLAQCRPDLVPAPNPT